MVIVFDAKFCGLEFRDSSQTTELNRGNSLLLFRYNIIALFRRLLCDRPLKCKYYNLIRSLLKLAEAVEFVCFYHASRCWDLL